MVSSHSVLSPPIYPSPYITNSSPTIAATVPSRFPATILRTAPDFGAAVLLGLGAGVVDDELEEGEAEELEDAAAELDVVDVVEVVEVTIPPDEDVPLAMIGVGVTKDVVSVMIAFGTEAVEAKPSVATETAPLAAEDEPATALEAASALWTAAEA